MVDFDWNEWAKNFPITFEVLPAEAGMPEGIEISRANRSIYISMEELSILEGLVQSAKGETVDLGRFELDPEPWYGPWGRSDHVGGGFEGEALSFEPREGYSQNREDYA